MSQRGTDFLNTWISGHLDTSIPPEHQDVPIEALAASCIRDAADAGIPQTELEEDSETVEDVIRKSLGRPTEGIVSKLVRKDG